MGKTILIVDDAAFMRMMIKDILTKNGYEVVGEAQDGVEAVEKYKELDPDLVTMDITMPEMDGVTALKEIKKIDIELNMYKETIKYFINEKDYGIAFKDIPIGLYLSIITDNLGDSVQLI